MRLSVVWPALVLYASACAQSAPPDEGPAPFRAGIVSTEAAEFALTLSPDGEAYFNRVVPGEPIHIWVSTDNTTPPEKLAFSDPRYADIDPHFSPIGDRLYFSSDRPRPGAESEAPELDMNTWFVERAVDGWGPPTFAGDLINTRFDEVFVTEDDESALYFARFGEGAGRARPTSLMKAERTTNGFGEPEPISTRPADLRLSNPAISPDGQTLVAAASPAPDSPPDLYVSRRDASGPWSIFTALPPPVNAPEAAEFAPGFSADGRWFFFTSDRGGKRDIFMLSADSIVRPQAGTPG